MSKIQFFYLANQTGLQTTTIISDYRKKTLLLIAVCSIVKCFLAFWLELGNDEAYYWFYSQYLQWNYFDHPPVIALWIRFFTANLSLDSYEGFVRLGSVAGSALATWFIYKASSTIHSEKAGWFAALLYNASFYSSITAGLYSMPDSPQMVFWTLSMWMIAKIISEENSWKYWILFGIVSGLCIMSKVHGAFLWIGMGGFVLFQRSSWLKKPQLYLALLITMVIISPIFFWNMEYNFATFRFHSNRIDVDELVLQWRFLVKEIGSEIGFNNPINFFLVLSALIAWFGRKTKYNAALSIYISAGLPLIVLLLVVSIFRNVTLPHWSGPAYVALTPLAAIALAERSKKSFPNILKWSIGVFAITYTGYSLITKFYPGTLGAKNISELGRGDITLDMYGWREASENFQAFYKKEIATGIMPRNAAMVTTHWWGAHVEYYFARPLKLKMIGLGKPQYLNEYLWTNRWRKNEADLDNVYCIVPSGDKYAPPTDFYRQKELVYIIPIKRNGKPAHEFLVYRLKGLQKEVPVMK